MLLFPINQKKLRLLTKRGEVIAVPLLFVTLYIVTILLLITAVLPCLATLFTKQAPRCTSLYLI